MKKIRQEAFTFIELLVYISVSGIIMLGLSALLYWVIVSRTRIEATERVTSSGRLTFDRIVKEIRNSQSVYTPTTGSNQLSLVTRKGIPEGEPLTYIDFYQCGQDLCLKKEFELPVLLTGENVVVDNFFVEQNVGNPGSVVVSLSLSHENPNNKKELDVSVNLNSTISLRRY